MHALPSSIRLGRADCGDLANAARREWLVTNGLGGFASGTVAGLNSRRYHGLLVAALRPPLDRTLMVAKLDPLATYDGRRYGLTTNAFADGTIDPHGYRLIESFRLDGLIPCWSYAIADAILEQRVWMVHGANTSCVTYSLTRASGPLELALTPLCTYRDFHHLAPARWEVELRAVEGGFELKAFPGAQPYRVVADRALFRGADSGADTWYRAFQHPVETERGFDDREDLFVPGILYATLQPGETLTVVCSTEPVAPHAGAQALEAERERQVALLRDCPADEPDWLRQLTLAADAFIVRRAQNDVAGTTVLAGYPWFSDWGRDTMIALPGLTLATGRPAVAAEILRTFARYVSDGMLPNRFPDAGETPEYNTVDATLWAVHAVDAYTRHAGDFDLARELYATLVDIIDWHQRGTRYQIHADPADGLLYAGEPGVQLTWMDAKVGENVITPRIGKPVEVNALWHHALRVMADLAERFGDTWAAGQYRAQADRVAAAFLDRFWYAAGGYLYDVIDGPEGMTDAQGRRADATLRPNQILAVALPHPLLAADQAKAVVDVCARQLWTSHGLRSLAPGDPAYIGAYRGGPVERDGAYHQGTVWSWLAGPFVTAHFRVYGDAAAARGYLAAFELHLADAGLGSISEIFDGDAPHRPDGCFAQAWGVAEVLRAWREVGGEKGIRGGSGVK
jgi:predicted glycogen debranching enzyme